MYKYWSTKSQNILKQLVYLVYITDVNPLLIAILLWKKGAFFQNINKISQGLLEGDKKCGATKGQTYLLVWHARKKLPLRKRKVWNGKLKPQLLTIIR